MLFSISVVINNNCMVVGTYVRPSVKGWCLVVIVVVVVITVVCLLFGLSKPF